MVMLEGLLLLLLLLLPGLPSVVGERVVCMYWTLQLLLVNHHHLQLLLLMLLLRMKQQLPFDKGLPWHGSWVAGLSAFTIQGH